MNVEQAKTRVEIPATNWPQVLADEIKRGDENTVIVVNSEAQLELGQRAAERMESQVRFELKESSEGYVSPSPNEVEEIEQEARLGAAVNLVVSKLSDQELATLVLDISWGDGDMRSRCEGRNCFSKIEHLFTEDGGKNLHRTVEAAIHRIANRRLK